MTEPVQGDPVGSKFQHNREGKLTGGLSYILLGEYNGQNAIFDAESKGGRGALEGDILGGGIGLE